MKVGSLFLVLLSIANLAFANYVGNPLSPDLPKIISFTRCMTYTQQDYWLNAKLDYEKEYMQNMCLQYSAFGSQHRVEFAHFYGNFLTLTANILKRVDFYVKGGAVDPRFEFGLVNGFGATANDLTNQKTIPAWALGTKVLVFKRCDLSFGVEASYFQTDHRNELLYAATSPIGPAETLVRWYNWQVSAGFAYTVCPFVPYIGAKYSRTIVTFDQSTPALQVPLFKMDNRRKFGCYLGCTLLASRYFELNFEGRFIDEQAFSGTMGFRF